MQFDEKRYKYNVNKSSANTDLEGPRSEDVGCPQGPGLNVKLKSSIYSGVIH